MTAPLPRATPTSASESAGVVYVAYPNALVAVNVTGKQADASFPKALAGKNGIPTSQTFAAYEYKIWLLK